MLLQLWGADQRGRSCYIQKYLDGQVSEVVGKIPVHVSAVIALRAAFPGNNRSASKHEGRVSPVGAIGDVRMTSSKLCISSKREQLSYLLYTCSARTFACFPCKENFLLENTSQTTMKIYCCQYELSSCAYIHVFRAVTNMHGTKMVITLESINVCYIQGFNEYREASFLPSVT